MLWHDEMSRDGAVVKVPATLKPGRYVVGFRYDCDATAQVWQNCADITVEAAESFEEA